MVEYINFEIFKDHPEVLAAFSTKKGGVSTGIYESMNLSLSSSDALENVRENYRRFAETLGISPEQFVISNQQHTDNISIATADDRGRGLFQARDFDAVDGYITNVPGLALCLLFADCVPVYLYDPVNHAAGLVHSGWKGTVRKISEKALRMMKQEYGTNPKNVLAVIGPSICQDCYEVSEDLLYAFAEKFDSILVNEFFKFGRVTEDGEQKYQLSLWKAIEYTLLDAGISPAHICNPKICTCCNHETFFSHRYTRGRRGNLAAVLMLR